MKEIWKDIKDFENCYQVSSKGRVKSLARLVKASDGRIMRIKERILKLSKTQGYTAANIGGRKRIHRFVGEAFLRKIKGKNFINHKNGIRNDNHVQNLEWVTHKENIQHAACVLKTLKSPWKGKFDWDNKNSKPVIQQNWQTGKPIKLWASASQVSRTLRFDLSDICKACKSVRGYSNGFKWRYATATEIEMFLKRH